MSTDSKVMDIVNLKIMNFLTIGDAPLIEMKDRGVNDTDATSNGVDKSSISDALCWALYGSTTRDESGDAVVNIFAKKNCFVRVSLQDGTSKYRITRYRKHSVFKNSTVVEIETVEGNWFDLSKETDKETQEIINGIVGCTLEVFMSAIYDRSNNSRPSSNPKNSSLSTEKANPALTGDKIMKSTEQKIREAYWDAVSNATSPICEEDFREGYLYLLNNLISIGADSPGLYRLPEGVTKCYRRDDAHSF